MNGAPAPCDRETREDSALPSASMEIGPLLLVGQRSVFGEGRAALPCENKAEVGGETRETPERLVERFPRKMQSVCLVFCDSERWGKRKSRCWQRVGPADAGWPPHPAGFPLRAGLSECHQYRHQPWLYIRSPVASTCCGRDAAWLTFPPGQSESTGSGQPCNAPVEAQPGAHMSPSPFCPLSSSFSSLQAMLQSEKTEGRRGPGAGVWRWVLA